MLWSPPHEETLLKRCVNSLRGPWKGLQKNQKAFEWLWSSLLKVSRRHLEGLSMIFKMPSKGLSNAMGPENLLIGLEAVHDRELSWGNSWSRLMAAGDEFTEIHEMHNIFVQYTCMLDRYFCCENINRDLYFWWKILFFLISYLYGGCVFVVFTLWNLLLKKRCVFVFHDCCGLLF